MSFNVEQYKRREKTLRAAVLLSLWAPLAAGIAVLFCQSITQLADFIRRSVELVAMFTAWLTFRKTVGIPGLNPQRAARLERLAGLSVAVTMGCSGLTMLGLAAVRAASYQPGGNVFPGLTIAGLGLAVNVWFWQRYRRLTQEQTNSITAAQSRLYRAKSMADMGVILALGAVAISPAHLVTRCVDLLGTAAVALYLLWSGLSWLRRARLPEPGASD